MSKAEIQQRTESYKKHTNNIFCFWDKNKQLPYTYAPIDITQTTEEQNINFEKLIFEYFNVYYNDFRYNALCKSRFERSRISVAIVDYCVDVKRGRWVELEPTLIKDNVIAINYISTVVKGRMLEYEEILENKISTKKIYEYARATKQKMPEKFHNIMLAYNLANNRHAKGYFNYLRQIND